MSSGEYLPIDDSDSSSAVSHSGGREYRSGSLTFWAILSLCLCGFIVLRWTLLCFPSGEKKNSTNASITRSFLLDSLQSEEVNKGSKDIVYPKTKANRIRRSSRRTTARAECTGHCLGKCNQTISDCISSCTTRCMRLSSHLSMTKTRQMIQDKISKREEGQSHWLEKAHGDHNAEMKQRNHKEWEKVYCVCRFCLHIAKFCSMLNKHWGSSCGDDLQQCEIEHCGVDEFCVQIVNDGMENDPIFATIRVLEICLDAGLFYS